MRTDVRDVAGMSHATEEAEIDAVIHLAALHFIPACERDPQRAIRTNVEGTQGVPRAVS